jgi:hypothetical protein
MALLLIYEFVVFELILLMAIIMIQTFIRAFVCYHFLTKGLMTAGFNEKTTQQANKIYIGFNGALLALTLILAVIPGADVNCNSGLFSYHWYILDSIDLVNSMIILASSFFIYK